MPKISIVVIGYNVEAYIEQCIESLLVQTYDDYDIVYVDDGSRDSSFEKVQRMQENHPELIALKKANGGIVSARKFGVQNSSGEYICFMDGDDWADEKMLEMLASGLDSSDGSKMDIVMANTVFQRPDGTFFTGTSCKTEEYLEGDEYLNRILQDDLEHYMVSKLYRKEFLLTAGYLDYPHVSMAEDLMTNAFFGLFRPKVCLLIYPVYYYRYNAAGFTKAGDERLLEQVHTLEQMELFFEKRDPERRFWELLKYQWFLFLSIYLLRKGVNPTVKKKIAAGCRRPLRGWSKNVFALKRWRRFSRSQKGTILVYLYCPFLAKVYEYVVDVIQSAKKKKRRCEAL